MDQPQPAGRSGRLAPRGTTRAAPGAAEYAPAFSDGFAGRVRILVRARKSVWVGKAKRKDALYLRYETRPLPRLVLDRTAHSGQAAACA